MGLLYSCCSSSCCAAVDDVEGDVVPLPLAFLYPLPSSLPRCAASQKSAAHEITAASPLPDAAATTAVAAVLQHLQQTKGNKCSGTMRHVALRFSTLKPRSFVYLTNSS